MDVQQAVEQVASTLRAPVLVEDATFRPLWWSAQDDVDEVRRRSILGRQPPPEAAALAHASGIAESSGPVRTPALPGEMGERWCVPIRGDGHLLGYVWVLDPEERLTASDLACMESLVPLARAAMSRPATTDPPRDRRGELLARLLNARDVPAARELAATERLPTACRVGVLIGEHSSGWRLGDGMTAVPEPPPRLVLTGGRPLPLVDLAVCVRRAVATQRALAAGARLASPSWDDLGVWHLVVGAPPDLTPEMVQPGADVLLREKNQVLRTSVRVLVDHGGDVVASAAELHVHRSTLHYRMDRVRDLTGVDLREGGAGEALNFALRLAAYRSLVPPR